jgi:hypothetical protein
MTYEGIDVMGERLAWLVIRHAQHLASAGRKKHVARLSLVAYSLGGLIARFAAGRLLALGMIRPASYADHAINALPPPAVSGIGAPWEAANFVTFASPHLSCWEPASGSLYRSVFNVVLPYSMSRTGAQLVLADRVPACGPRLGSHTKINGSDHCSCRRPLLVLMADSSCVWHAALRMFKTRILLANIRCVWSIRPSAGAALPNVV